MNRSAHCTYTTKKQNCYNASLPHQTLCYSILQNEHWAFPVPVFSFFWYRQFRVAPVLSPIYHAQFPAVASDPGRRNHLLDALPFKSHGFLFTGDEQSGRKLSIQPPNHSICKAGSATVLY